MTYVVTDNCIACKYTDCVEVCPVDCFYEGENMLVIHPDECIDCGVCEPECPADAIRPDTVFLAFHWAGELSANLLTNDATDPVSGMPEFKVCAVRLERVRGLEEVPA